MAEMNAAFFEEAKYNLQHGKINFLNVAGLIPEVAEERHVVVRLPANSMHLNHVNIVYAGSYFVLAESSGATLIKCTYAGKYVPIIKSVNIDYRKPTKRDLIVDISMTEPKSALPMSKSTARGSTRSMCPSWTPTACIAPMCTSCST